MNIYQLALLVLRPLSPSLFQKDKITTTVYIDLFMEHYSKLAADLWA